MPVTNYYSANGVIIAEHTTGQSRLDYVTDALGSVIATIDQTLTVKSTARYKPYGATLAQTGTQPMYGWVGAPGYRRTGLPHTDAYVRKRHLSTPDGRWSSVDLIWPSERAYECGRSSPSTYSDPLGLAPTAILGVPVQVQANNCLNLPLPPVVWFGVTVRFSVRACIQSYDRSCCKPPGPWAVGCADIGLRAQFRIAGPSFGPEDIRYLANLYADIHGGILNLALGGTQPIKECKTVYSSFDVKVCV